MTTKSQRHAVPIVTSVLALALFLAPVAPSLARASGLAVGGNAQLSGSQLTPTVTNGNLHFTGYVMFVDNGMKKATVDVRFSVRGIAVGNRGVSLRIHSVRKSATGYVATARLSFAGISQMVKLPMRLAITKTGHRTTNHYRFNQTLRGSR